MDIYSNILNPIHTCVEIPSKDLSKPYCVYFTSYRGNKLPPFYIGSGITKEVLNGNYSGSASSERYGKIWYEELENNPHLFKSKVVCTFTNRTQAYAKENKLQRLLNVIKSPMYTNMSFALYLHAGQEIQYLQMEQGTHPSQKIYTCYNCGFKCKGKHSLISRHGDQCNQIVTTFYNKDGRMFTGFSWQLIEKYPEDNLSIRGLTRIISGKYKNSCGWKLDPWEEKETIYYTFYHNHYGKFYGTAEEFDNLYQYKSYNCHDISYRLRFNKSCEGWRLQEKEIKPKSDWNAPVTECKFCNRLTKPSRWHTDTYCVTTMKPKFKCEDVSALLF